MTMNLMARRLVVLLLAGFAFACTWHAQPGGEARAAGGDPGATAGELILERPTLRSLGFEWRLSGDVDGDATAAVRYREQGRDTWREGMPLMRIGMGFKVHLAMACGWPQYVIPDAVAGSVLDLTPGTTYEVRLELRDPDGVAGEAVRELTLTTRAEPVVPDEAPVRHVYPPDWEGPKQKPHYRNIMEAVNGYAPVSDVYLTVRPTMEAKPGTVIKMHAGVHAYDNQRYWKPEGRPAHSYWQHGTITLVAKGTPEKPIYIVAAGDGEVILDGNGCHTLFNLRSTDYLHFEGLTIRGCDIAFHGGWQGLRGGGMKGLTIRHCWIEDVVWGVLAQDGGSRDFLISDNVILGRGPQKEMGRFGRSETGYAVNLAGQGHVVSHNYVANFWDGINVFTGSHSSPEWGQQSRSIDFHHNDIHNCADQFMEADGGYANIRIQRNRMFNGASQPISAQPVHAGPVYWIGNVLWRAGGGKQNMKQQMFAQAYVFCHNTAATHMTMVPNQGLAANQSTWLIANNLCLGPADGRPPLVYAPGPADHKHEAGHNAHHVGPEAGPWIAGETEADSLAELQELTGHERGSRRVDFRAVVRAEPEVVFARGRGFVVPAQVELMPRPGGPLIDAGRRLPGINDDYAGDAPDIGALEHGREPPHFGPRRGPYLDRLQAHRAQLAEIASD